VREILLIDTDQRILWANNAALSVHGIKRQKDLGTTVSEYRRRFKLRYRNRRRVEGGKYPMERVTAGESFSDLMVVVTTAKNPEQHWVHSIRCLVIADDTGEPDYFVLILRDETARFEAEDRFESAFNANPAPAAQARVMPCQNL
jgi:PAS domain-containing protein